jgi:predicted enzyme related to lactoylglutathione lyase
MTDVRENVTTASTNDNAAETKGEFIWYELMTPDAEGAKAFYDAVVGWNIGEGTPEFNGYRMIGRSDGGFAGGVLPLTDEMQQHGARPTWLGYIHVPDVDAAVASIEEAGGKALMPAFDIPGIGRIAMVTDPQGAPFYVMKPIPPVDRPQGKSDVFSPDALQRVGWNELSTSDAVAALDFYTAQFGWEKGDAMPMGDKGDYRFINLNGQMLGAIFPAQAGAFNDEHPHWRFYFRVPSVSAAKTAAEQAGGTIKVGPMEVPGGDIIIIGTDPQGAEFALVGGK